MFKPQKISDLMLKKQLTDKKLKVNDLASQIGVAYSTLNTIRQGTTNPTVEIMERICSYFDVDMNYFFDDEGWPSKNKIDETNDVLVTSDAKPEYESKSKENLMIKVIDLQEKLIDLQQKMSQKDEELTRLLSEIHYLKNDSATEKNAKAG